MRRDPFDDVAEWFGVRPSTVKAVYCLTLVLCGALAHLVVMLAHRPW